MVCNISNRSGWSNLFRLTSFSAFVFSNGFLQSVFAGEMEQAKTLVLDVLDREAAGECVDRRSLCQPLDETVIDKAARWQSGDLWVDQKWMASDRLNESSWSMKLKPYLKERGDARLDKDGNRKMAVWCDKHGFMEQAGAHWYGVLNADPNDTTARNKLGFEKIDGKWLSKEEINRARVELNQRIANLRRWWPQTEKWAKGIASSKTAEKLAALKSLEYFNEPTAVFALEQAALQLEGERALPFVEAIKRIRSEEACHSLLDIAIDAPSSPAGRMAIEGLRDYSLVMYVPDLIESLGPEATQSHFVFSRPNGETVLRWIERREYREMERVNVSDRVVSGTKGVSIEYSVRLDKVLSISPNATRAKPRPNTVVLNEGNSIAQQVSLQNSIRTAERSETASMVREEELKNRALHVLGQCSGEDYGDRPSAWWDWWDRTNEMMRVGEKSSAARYREDRSQMVYRTEVQVTRYSCLVAGTLVQTATGLRPIESIRVGDLVVSQNIETGELSLKPVLNTTLRPPAKTIRFETEQGAIQATLGHYWWVGGKGWVRTKELEVGMNLHHAKGTSKITKISSVDEEVETYNLAVGDNHTYLVGPEGVLSNDATELRPTLQVVPGLPHNPVIAKR